MQFLHVAVEIDKIRSVYDACVTDCTYTQRQTGKQVHYVMTKVFTMAAHQLCWPPAILFCCCRWFLLFLAPNLRGHLADRHQTLPYVRWWPSFIKFGQKFGWPLPPAIWVPRNIKISARFRTTSRLDREYPRNATRLRQSENCVANYGHSRTGKLNSVYFGPQTAKNRTGVLTHPTGGDQAGHRHASIQIFALNIIVFCKSLSKKISNAWLGYQLSITMLRCFMWSLVCWGLVS